MSQLGTPYSPPPPYAPPPVPPASRPRSEDIPSWIVLLAAAMCMALAGLLGYVVLNTKTDPVPPAPPRARHSFPDHWNHQIAPLARIAAKNRGLHFVHPVAVRFLSPEKFRKTLTKDDGKTTARDKRQLQRAEAELRAVGLLNGHVDLLRAVKSATGAEVLAYYSFKTKSITVRGRTLTPSVKATLVHELTHVLQDQNFHIGRRLAQLQKAKGPTTQAYDVLDAIVEGDADRVEQLYRSSLQPAQQHALDVAQQHESDAAKPGLAGIPQIVVAELSAPYELGLAMTQTVSAQGGNHAVNQLLRTPPTHDVALLDPLDALGHANTVQVPPVAVSGQEKKFETGEFGAVSLYLMLASRDSEHQALAAADGWGGDSFVAYHQGHDTCMRMQFAGATAGDTAQIRTALQSWSAAGPSGSTVKMVDGRVQVQSCDPGTGAHAGAGNAQDAVTYAAVRNQYVLTFIRAHVPPAASACITEHLFATYPISQLSDPAFGSKDQAIQDRVRQFAVDCR